MEDALFAAAGDLADAYRSVDWAAGPLGAPETWSPTLRSTIELALRTEFPVSMFWGPELVLLYNAAYVTLIGEKHPAGLGGLTPDVFPEAWEQIGPWMKACLDEGRTTYAADELVPLVRRGFLEECYFTFSYSLVGDVGGPDHGVINIATETTTSVVAQRRLRLLGRLVEVLAELQDPAEVATVSLPLLRAATDDLVEVDLVPEDGPAAPATPLGRRDWVVDEREDETVVWLALRSDGDHRGAHLDPRGFVTAARPLLVVRPSPRLLLDSDHLLFLRLVAATLGQTLDRVEALAAERRVAAAERVMSETLQRSLLGRPQSVGGCRVAVRYQPALDLAQIGGDWHDSFPLPGGRLALVIGDVAGHDQQAAAAMAQTRNLLRGIAHTLDGDPAAALTALDRALLGLEVETFATSVLATLDLPVPGVDGASPRRTLRWANAGHPAPVLLTPDGAARLLDPTPELLLGVHAEVERSDHQVELDPGSTVLFFTDGLVERRSHLIDEGLDAVVAAMSGMAHLDPEALCDHVLERVDPSTDDDLALLCLRVD